MKGKERAVPVSSKITPLGAAIYALAVFLTAVTQSCIGSGVGFFGTFPALGLCLCCAAGYFDGERVGATVGLGVGVCIDALGSSGFSLVPVVYAALGYFVGCFSATCRGRMPFGQCFLSYCVRLGCAVGVGAVTTVAGIFIGARTPHLLSAIFLVALPESVISFVAGLFFWLAYRIIYIKRTAKKAE